MSKVTKRTVTHLDVVFDGEVLDADSGELLHTAPILGRFDSGSEAGFLGEFESVLFRPARPVRRLMLKLRFDGELWDTCRLEAPKLHFESDKIAVYPRLYITKDEFASLLTIAEDAA
jgi:hypothetical protein